MATAELVDEMIEAGEKLLSALDRSQVKVRSALWFYDENADEWRLILAMPVVEDQGLAKAQELVSAALKAGSVPGLFLRQIAIVSPSDELVTLLRKAVRAERGVSAIRLSRSAIGNTLIEDALIYRST